MAVIVFDFDGTLADMKALIMEVGNEIITSAGYPKVDEATYQRLSKGSVRQGIKQLGIPLLELPRMVIQGKRQLELRTSEAKLFPGILELVSDLKKSGHDLFVLSANSRKIILDVLHRHKIDDKLIVLPSSGMFGKASSLKRFIFLRRLDRENVWLVGDELRDLEAARKAHVRSIAVTWGLQNPETLRDAKPDYVVDHPAEIAQIINQN